MARAAPGTTNKNVVKVDFSGVETASVIPEGEYTAEVVKVSKESSDAGNDYLAWELKVAEGKHEGKKLYNNTSLAAQSLWATKRFLECLGVEVPDGAMNIDLGDMVGLQVGLVVEHQTYKGRAKSAVIDSFPIDGEATAGDDDEKADDKKADAGDLPTKEEIEEMGKTELAALVDDHELDVELTGTTAAQRRQVVKAVEAKGLDEDVKKAEASAKPSAKAAAKEGKAKKVKKVPVAEVNEADEDALTELIETHELDVDLSKFATTRRKRAAVIDALEAAELLDEDE